jgi:outer membrane protein assembly factor BamB
MPFGRARRATSRRQQRKTRTNPSTTLRIPTRAWPHPTPLAYGDYLYVLLDRGFLTCYDARTGEIVYEKERLGPAAFTASPWAYGGKLFCLSEDGDTVVVRAGREFKVLGKNSLGEMCMATPALAGGGLFIRTQSKLYCLRQAANRGEK